MKGDQLTLDATLQSFWSKPLLPYEPRIFNPAFQQALTKRHLLAKLAELECYFLSVRSALDPQLQQLQPTKLGKPYPLGQCLEIATAVYKRLKVVKRSELPPEAIAGFEAMRSFLNNGGTFRLVWGDLRGQYFQNAFQLGTLYLDVANDTVVPTKPKVEILPFEQANIVPIKNFEHFRTLAQSYWQDEVFPNHLMPALAPFCPLLHISKEGAIRIHDASNYMIAMTQAGAFEPSESALRAPPLPAKFFGAIREVLDQTPFRVAANPERGRQEALHFCQQYRAKRWQNNEETLDKIILDVQQINHILAQYKFTKDLKEKTMDTVKIDDVEYDLDSLSEEANTQLKNLQFVDQEIARLQAKAAVLQTARGTYASALKAALPEK